MLITAAYSVSGIRPFKFLRSKTPTVETIKKRRECETNVRQYNSVHDMNKNQANLLSRNLSETSGLKRFEYCFWIICMFEGIRHDQDKT